MFQVPRSGPAVCCYLPLRGIEMWLDPRFHDEVHHIACHLFAFDVGHRRGLALANTTRHETEAPEGFAHALSEHVSSRVRLPGI